MSRWSNPYAEQLRDEEITRETVSRVYSEPERLYKMTAIGFERFVAEIFRGLDYQVRTTQRSHDGGVDLYLDYNLHLITPIFVVQCKYRESPKRRIGVGVARELLGTIFDKAVTAGILVTNYKFSAATTKTACEAFDAALRRGSRWAVRPDGDVPACTICLPQRTVVRRGWGCTGLSHPGHRPSASALGYFSRPVGPVIYGCQVL